MVAEVMWDKRVEIVGDSNEHDLHLRGTIGIRGLEPDVITVFDVTIPKSWRGILADMLLASALPPLTQTIIKHPVPPKRGRWSP